MEDFRTLYVDPGEDTGWCLGKDVKLLAAGTEKMWPFADEVWMEVFQHGPGFLSPSSKDYLRDGVTDENASGPIGRIVCEDWRIYPEKALALSWDQCRTARLIGALTFIARVQDIPFVLQGANIKKRAQAGGAEELYYHPLHENRHQNDAIQHFVYFTQTELRKA